MSREIQQNDTVAFAYAKGDTKVKGYGRVFRVLDDKYEIQVYKTEVTGVNLGISSKKPITLEKELVRPISLLSKKARLVLKQEQKDRKAKRDAKKTETTTKPAVSTVSPLPKNKSPVLVKACEACNSPDGCAKSNYCATFKCSLSFLQRDNVPLVPRTTGSENPPARFQDGFVYSLAQQQWVPPENYHTIH